MFSFEEMALYSSSSSGGAVEGLQAPKDEQALGRFEIPGKEHSGGRICYFNGEIILEAGDVSGASRQLHHVRSFSNRLESTYAGPNGNNWLMPNWPYLVEKDSSTIVAMFGQKRIWFDEEGGEYAARYGADGRYTLQADGDLLVLHEVTNRGVRRFQFHDFEQVNFPEGMPLSGEDEAGNSWQMFYDAEERIEEVRWQAKDETAVAYSLVYVYHDSGPHEDRIETATLRRTQDVQASPVVWEDLRRAEYSYYDDSDADGNENDLKRVTEQVPDGSGGWEDAEHTHYRYYTSNDSPGFEHGLKYVVGPQAYAEMEAEGLDPLAESDAVVADYADHYFEYDSDGKVIKQVTRDCSSCQGGGGTGGEGEDYDRFENPNEPTTYNAWRWRTTHTLANGNTKTVYTNHLGQMLLEDLQEAGTSRHWIQYREYGEQSHNAGRLVREAMPSAVTGYDDSSDYLDVQLRSSEGLIRHQEYYETTTADGETLGGVKGRLKRELVQEGNYGNKNPQRCVEYKSSPNAEGERTYVEGRETRYVDEAENPTQPIETTYSYTWHDDSAVMEEKTTTLPAIPTSQNGDGTSATRKEYFDKQGRLTWEMDERGIISRGEYEQGGDLMIKRTEDADEGPIPSGWDPTPGDHENLVSEFDHDERGRVIEELGPEHEVELDGAAEQVRSATWHVYKEQPDHNEHWVGHGYQKVSDGSNHLVGPVEISITDKNGRTLHRIESQRSSGSGKLSASDTFDRADWTRWQSFSYDANGNREVERVYHNIPMQDPDQGLAGVEEDTGDSGTHYHETLFGYDKETQKQVREVTPAGTIRRKVYDGIQRLVSEWVGTEDTPTSGDWRDWSPSNNTGDANMVKVVEFEYDHGQDGGDSHRTEETRHVDGSVVRVTSFTYDYRGRMLTEDGEEDRFVEHTYDNLDREIKTEQRVGSASGQLVAKSETFFDDRDRVYERKVYAVDPDDGSVGNALTEQNWHDEAGNVVKHIEAGGGEAYTTHTFDNLGREVEQAMAYEHATDGEVVVERQTRVYNEVGSVVEIMTEKLDTGASTSSPSYRASYQAAWYDGIGREIAEANYGALSSFSRPSTTPSRSDDVLVMSFEFDGAGNRHKVTDPRGIVHREEFDDRGRKLKEIDNDVSSPSDPDEARVTEFTYHPNGEIETITAENNHTGDQTTTYFYGVTTDGGSHLNSNELLAAIEYPEDDASSRVELQYDRQGELIERKDQAGTVHRFEYDGLGRKVQDRVTSLGSGVDDQVRRIATEYGPRGNALKVTSYDHPNVGMGSVVNQVEREFNGFGELTVEYQEHEGEVDAASTPKVTYAYADGSENHARLTKLTYPNGREIDYTYSNDPADDALSRVSAIVDGAEVLASYMYLGAGTAVRVDYEQPDVRLDLWGGTVGSYDGLDRFDRVIDHRWHNYAASEDAVRIKHGYDRNGNRLYRRDEVARADNAEFDELYEYDQLDRLANMQRGLLNSDNTSITSKAFEQDWSLDEVGNWKQFCEDEDGNGSWDVDQARSHNKVNEIATISTWPDPEHDPAGNMTRMPKPLEPSESFTAVYDPWNRLVKLTDDADNDNTVAQYEFDGTGRRNVEETYDSGVLEETRFLLYSDGHQILEERVDDGGGASSGADEAVDLQYVWGQRYIDDLVCRDRDTSADGNLNEHLFGLPDDNFRVVALASASGDVIERYSYTSYGHRTLLNADWSAHGSPDSGAYDFRIGHQGLRHDEPTGLIYNRSRMLHPAMGRFGQRDSLGYVDGESLYQYVGGNPIVRHDPRGTFWDSTTQNKVFHPRPREHDGVCERIAMVAFLALNTWAEKRFFMNYVAGHGRPILLTPEEVRGVVLAASATRQHLDEQLDDCSEGEFSKVEHTGREPIDIGPAPPPWERALGQTSVHMGWRCLDGCIEWSAAINDTYDFDWQPWLQRKVSAELQTRAISLFENRCGWREFLIAGGVANELYCGEEAGGT